MVLCHEEMGCQDMVIGWNNMRLFGSQSKHDIIHVIILSSLLRCFAGPLHAPPVPPSRERTTGKQGRLDVTE